MQPIQHPDTIKMIHEAKVNEEMHRNRTRLPQAVDRPGPQPGDTIRIAIGTRLIAIGTRIASVHGRRPLQEPASH